MSRINITKKKKITCLILVIFLIIYYFIFNFDSIKSVYTVDKNIEKKIKNMEFYLGGEAVGIKLLATGVLVMGIDRADTSLQIGDIILEVNDTKIESNIELLDYAKKSDGKKIKLTIDRNGEEFETEITPLIDNISKEYKLGLWVKDSTARCWNNDFLWKK